jgi:hypothetical protein
MLSNDPRRKPTEQKNKRKRRVENRSKIFTLHFNRERIDA